jgi:hypothetical protein
VVVAEEATDQLIMAKMADLEEAQETNILMLEDLLLKEIPDPMDQVMVIKVEIDPVDHIMVVVEVVQEMQEVIVHREKQPGEMVGNMIF